MLNETANISVKQKTLKDEISCVGVGLHTGEKVSLTLKPANINTGIVFRRVDIAGKGAVIPARFDNVVDTRLCTCIGNDEGVRIATIEHLMAALNAMEIDNIEIDIDSSEMPAMDGSAAPFVFLIECAGVVEQNAPKKVIEILKDISVEENGAFAGFSPTDDGLEIDFDIDFSSKAIGHQSTSYTVNAEDFKADISKARTFGFLQEIEQLRAMGLARGGSLDNAILINGDEIVNEDGLRYKDEFVRHKILDAVGDIFTAGYNVIGRYVGSRSGHALTNKLLKKLFNDPTSYRIIDATDYLPKNVKQDNKVCVMA